jgi:diguanylate cyclase (GGDEF)-like protein
VTTPAPRATPLVERGRALERDRGYGLRGQLDAARALERAADAAGDRVAAARAALVRADVTAADGDVETASALVQDAARTARDDGDDELLARTHFVRFTLHHRAGDVAGARWHAVRAVELLPADAPAWLRAEHLLALSVVLDRAFGSYDAVIDEVLAIAAAEGDPRLELFALNNTTWECVQTGRVADAARGARRMRRLAATTGVRLRRADLDTIATVELRDGRLEEAWATITEAFAPDCPDIDVDQEPVARLTAFRVLTALGRPEEALEQLRAARAVGAERRLPGVLAEVEEADATHRAAVGDWEGAYRAHVRFHAEHVRLQARRHAARALLAQAQFDASAARRDRDRFRALALTDSLTGLPNRRAVEEHVQEVLDGPGPVALAIVDLDHFKRVNDERSHDAGDAVLRELGVLLQRFAAAAPGLFCARLGGEEFVVVWDGWVAEAVERSARTLRAAVEEHDWSAWVPGIPVTASVGLTAPAPGTATTWSDLLAGADARLYEAKRGGRNRVVGPCDVPAPATAGR